MNRVINKINNIDIFEYSYNDWKNSNELNPLEGEGANFRFYRWLKKNIDTEINIEDVWNNTSAIRDGNRIDIHDNYEFFNTKLQISFLYVVNSNVWVVLYNPQDDSWYGEFEIPQNV